MLASLLFVAVLKLDIYFNSAATFRYTQRVVCSILPPPGLGLFKYYKNFDESLYIYFYTILKCTISSDPPVDPILLHFVPNK